jgi:hypothetical protein
LLRIDDLNKENLPDAATVQNVGAFADFSNAVNVIRSDLGNRLVDEPLHRLRNNTIICFYKEIYIDFI